MLNHKMSCQMTSNKKNFDSIPGTYVFTKEHSRKGYHLNMFCMSLNIPANREAFRDDERGYLERFSMTLHCGLSCRFRRERLPHLNWGYQVISGSFFRLGPSPLGDDIP